MMKMSVMMPPNHTLTIEKNLQWLMVLYLKGKHIVIPSKLRQSCPRLHIAHMGINKALCQAKQSVFWPGLTKNIMELISACPVCMKYAAKNCAKPLVNDLAATKPWQALSIDNFEWKGHKYLIILDCFSHCCCCKKFRPNRYCYYYQVVA